MAYYFYSYYVNRQIGNSFIEIGVSNEHPFELQMQWNVLKPNKKLISFQKITKIEYDLFNA